MIFDGIKKKVFRNADADLLITSLLGNTFQIANSSSLTSKLLGGKPRKFSNDDKLNKRFKIYLKGLLKKYLLV